MKVLSLEDVRRQFASDPNPEKWTVIIPAAGKGTRLGYDKPKILYPIAGRPILDWLIDLLEPYCQTFHVVLSPSGEPVVRPHLERRVAGRFKTHILESRGMADSIYKAVPHVSTPYTLIIWGDQVAIRPETIRGVMQVQEGHPNTALVMPMVQRPEPYVHYATDAHGKFTHVLEKREGAEMPAMGLSDCGVFACDTHRLQSIFNKEIKKGITLSRETKEWNFLPLLPQFESKQQEVTAVMLQSLEETIGVNDKHDAAKLETYLRSFATSDSATETDKLRVVLFSGGRGTGSISDALMKYPDIELTMLVNAYDDGKSTGLLRRFIPGMLGPSDIRKVVSGLLKHKSDRSSQALRQLMEYRLPDEVTTEEALTLLRSFVDWSHHATHHEVLAAKEALSLSQLRLASRYLKAFLDYYETAKTEYPWFTFADNSLGNLFFAGCFLLADRDFNQAIDDFCDFAEVGRRVVNITQGENLVLVGVKEDGRYMVDEASVQGEQDASRIEEIFLLPGYLDASLPDLQSDKEHILRFLRQQETVPRLNPHADSLLREADVIIYGPGTQHSSLFPSYLTSGVAEAISANKKAEKIFIANIARDNDILAEDATSLVDEFLWSMSRKEAVDVRGRDVITRFFFQKPEAIDPASPNYLPFDAADFAYPLDRVVWIDLEGAKGKHAGGCTVSELLLVVDEQLRKRVRHVPHKVSIIVPVLNEAKTIKQVLHDLKDVQFATSGLEKEIIVVDGGSTDGTVSLVQNEPNVRFFSVTTPRGRGAALQVGIEKAKGELVIFFPSDGEYTVTDIARVLGPLLNQEFPVVFGSRAFRNDLSGTLQQVYGHKGVLFFLSKYGGMLLSILTLLFYHRYISDPLTSLKGFNARIFRDLPLQRHGVDLDMELIAKIAKAKYPILEVPVSYKARNLKEGKKITVYDGLTCLVTLVNYALYKPSARIKSRSTVQTQSKSLTTETGV